MELLKGGWGRWGRWGLRGAGVLGVVVLTAVVVPGLSRAIGSTGQSLTLAVPGRANATPSISSNGDRVAIAWSASLPSGETDVFVATSRDAGSTFSSPARVNDIDGDARVSGEQPPRVFVSASTVTVVWTSKGERGTALRFARSTDEGRSFSASTPVPGSVATGNRGWEALASNFVIWLDHRELAADTSMAAMHHEHADAKPDGVAMAQKSKLMIASLDGAIEPHVITGGVCYCCKTALAASASGAVYAAWRHVYPGNLRDIAFTMSRDGGRTFATAARVSEDQWELEGCPDDGPAMAVDASSRVHIVWPTVVTVNDEPTVALFYSSSSDGKRFSPRQRIPTEGLPHHPQIAVASNGSVALAWDELAGGGRRAVVGHATPGSGGRFRVARRVVEDGAAYYPVLATTPRGAVAAWTSGRASASVIRVTRATE